MDVVLLLIQQNLVMFVYLIIGYLLIKSGIMTNAGSGEVGKMLLYLVMPVAIIRSFIREFSTEMLTSFVVSFLAALAALALAVVVSLLIFRKRSGVRVFGTAFSNAGFIGIPLTQMVLGDEAVLYVASFVAILNFLQWTFGIWVMTGDTSVISPKKIVKNPILIAFAVGLILLFLPVTLPAPVSGLISTIASMNGPLAMIVLGAYLAQVPPGSLFTDKDSYLCTAVRLLLIPLLTILLFWLLPAPFQPVKLALLLTAAAPVGSNVAIWAQIYNADYKAAVRDVCLSTLFSIFTMPLIIMISSLVW